MESETELLLPYWRIAITMFMKTPPPLIQTNNNQR